LGVVMVLLLTAGSEPLSDSGSSPLGLISLSLQTSGLAYRWLLTTTGATDHNLIILITDFLGYVLGFCIDLGRCRKLSDTEVVRQNPT